MQISSLVNFSEDINVYWLLVTHCYNSYFSLLHNIVLCELITDQVCTTLDPVYVHTAKPVLRYKDHLSVETAVRLVCEPLRQYYCTLT
jgi:hypothetical protein